MGTEFRTSLRFNESQSVPTTITSNGINFFGRSPDSRRRRQQSNMNFPQPVVSGDPISVLIKDAAHGYGDVVSNSLPNLRRLLELQQQHKQTGVVTSLTPNNRAAAKQNRLYLQPFNFISSTSTSNRVSSPPLPPPPPPPTAPQPPGPGISISNTIKLQAVNRSLVRSRHLALRNTCDLETQLEARMKADLIAYKKRSLELKRKIHEHLLAENRPTRGLFFEMIFSKRHDRSRQPIRESQFGVVDALSSESEQFYRYGQQPGRPVLKKRGGDMPNYETPTPVAVSIAKQLDPDRSIQVGVNGRPFSGSSGWSTATPPLAVINDHQPQQQQQGHRQKKRVEIRL